MLGTPDPVDPLVVGPAAGANPILVIGNTGDPATPYEWSVALADFLDSAVLYTVEAEGHTAYTSIDCVEPVVNAYLIDLELPDAGSSCSDNADADFFVPAGESEFDILLALFDCLRDNGADIPDISLSDLLADPTGEQLADLFDPSDPAFFEAALQCADLLDDSPAGCDRSEGHPARLSPQGVGVVPRIPTANGPLIHKVALLAAHRPG